MSTIELQRALLALNYLDPGCPRHEWVRIGMAAKAAGLAFENFYNWSKSASNFISEKDCRDTWQSFNAEGGITAATLFKFAKDKGFHDSSTFKKTVHYKRIKQGDNMNVIKIWERCNPVNCDHPYITRKKGVVNGLKIYPIDAPTLIIKNQNVAGYLVVPCSVNEVLQTLQFIPPGNGEKLNLPKASFNDGYFLVGRISECIYICEGLGQAWAVYKASNAAAIVCFGAHRMMRISKVLREKYPNIRLIIVSDRGQEEISAKIAATINGEWIEMPEGAPKNYDVNDYLHEFDNDALQQLLENTNIPPKFEISRVDLTVQAIQKHEYPQLNSNRNPLDTYGNLKYLLSKLNITIRWNDMARRREVTIPNFPVFYDDQENSILNEVINLATINNMPTRKIDEHLTSLAQADHYHPIVDCIISNPWDGTERLDQFIATLKTSNDKFYYVLIRKWMLSAIVAAFSEKGFTSQGVLVLTGSQGIGKTRWIKSLDPINCNAVKEGAMLDFGNKDSIITLSGYWIVELGELDGTFRKSDVAKIKSHITNQIDEFRLPYAKKNSRCARRTVYAATVNEPRFLVDDTGNRRWWTIEVLSINLDHGLDMQQVWAEVHYFWACGEKPFLSAEESARLNILNIEHEQLDPFEEKVLSHFDWCDNWQNNNTLSLTATETLAEIGYITPSRSEATRMGKILKKLTGKNSYRRFHSLPRRRQS